MSALRALHADSLPLVENGKLKCHVLVQNHATLLHYANNSLATAFERVGGTRPPVTADTNQIKPNVVTLHVGLTPFAAAQKVDFTNFEDDGYVIRRVGERDAVLLGKTLWGTIFALMRFQEDALGFHRLWPGTLGEAFEPRKTISMPAAEIAHRGSPFRNRNWTFNYSDPANGFDFTYWGHLVTDRVAHDAGTIITAEKYGKEHPEYFALIDGKRVADGKGQWQPCLSNPDVRRIVVEHIKAFFKANPTYYSANFARRDGHGDCTCEGCLAMDPAGAGDPAYRSTTDRWIKFCNAVMEEVEKDHPTKLLNFYAYGRNIAPPVETRLHPKVYPYFTHASNPKYFSDAKLQPWLDKGMRHVGVYYYLYGQGFVVPRHYPHVLATKLREVLDLRRRHDLQHVSFRSEAYPYWPFDWLKLYVASRVLQYPDANVDTVIANACRLFYGKAAHAMQAFFDHCEKTYARGDSGCNESFITGFQSFNQFEQYNVADLETLKKRLDEAARLADSDPVEQRVAKTANAFGLTELCVREYHALKALAPKPASDADVRARMDNLVELIELGKQKKEFIETVARNDPHLSGQNNFYLNQLPDLTASAKTRIVPTMETISANLGARAIPHWEAAAKDSRYATLAPYVGMTLKLLKGVAPRIANFNGDLESSAPVPHTIATPDVRTDGCPPGWGFWHRKGSRAKFEWVEGEAHTGRRALKATGCEIATFVTTFPCDETKLYRISFHVRASHENKIEEFNTGCQDEQQAWIPGTMLETGITVGTEWTRFEQVFVPCKGAKFIGIALRAANQREDESLWFDTITVEEF